MANVNLPSLFGSPIVSEWRPEETLFSLASRQHVLSCNALAADTCRALFGHAQCGSAHDLPSRIDAFVERTAGAFGSAESIIRERTILPFYLPYRSPSDSRNAVASMRGDRIGALKAQLGMLAARFRAHHPLKACPDCMRVDHDAAATAHWRLPHQLPGVWICSVHGIPLLQSTIKSTGVGRFLWYLPDMASMHRPGASIDHAQVAWAELANCSLKTWSLPRGFHFDAGLLTATYRRAATQRGFISPAGRLRTKSLGAALFSVTASLRGLPELAALPSSVEDACSQFSRVLQKPRGIGHPLRHFVLILALLDTWENFWAAYEHERLALPSMEPSSDLRGSSAALTDEHDERKRTVLTMLRAGCSASAAASTVGVATGTALAWAAHASIPTSRRPKMLKPGLRKLVVRALRRGADKCSVAASYGISVQTVTMTLRTEIGLNEQWAAARRVAARRRARTDWLDAVTSCPRATTTEVRRKVPAAFAWLYRNDRAWLEEQSMLRPVASQSVGLRVEWDQRDRQYAHQITEANLTLATTLCARPVTLGMLCQVLPDLKPLLGKLDRLPLTEAALKNATRRRKRPESGTLDLI